MHDYHANYGANYSRERPHHPLNSTMSYVFRTLAVAAWASSGILYLFGLHATTPYRLSPDSETATPLDFYAAAFLVMLLAMSFTARVAAETIVSSTFAREAERSRAYLAEAVAEALAHELVSRGLVVNPDGDGDGDYEQISRIGPR